MFPNVLPFFCRQSRLSSVATTQHQQHQHLLLADLDCGFSRLCRRWSGGWDVDFIRISVLPQNILGPGFGGWDVDFNLDFSCTAQILGPGVGVWDVDFIWISVVPHNFLAQGSAFGMWMSLGFQLYRTIF